MRASLALHGAPFKITGWQTRAAPVYQAREPRPAARPIMGAQPWRGSVKQAEGLWLRWKRTRVLASPEGEGVRRRDFINIAAVSFAGVGGAALLYPLVNQMNPSADVLALAQIDVDLSAIQPGQAIKTTWRTQPIFIRNLTPAEHAGGQCGRRLVAARSADARRADQGRPSQLADHAWASAPIWAACRWARPRARTRANMAAISAPATARTTTPPRASAKARRRSNLEVPEYEFTTDTAVRIG